MSRTRPDRLPTPRVFTHLVVMLVVSAVLGVVVAGLAIPFAGVLGLAAKNGATSLNKLPASLNTTALPQKTRIVDDKGRVIATLYDQNRVSVPLDQISRIMTKAIVSIEDYRFYQHGAIDLKGTLRALVTNQANSGVVQGGSSITQQLVKLTLLNQAKTKKQQRLATADTYARKLKELRYAIALEQKHSKDWILERYLNTAYFGGGAYGVQSAARHYFGVNARALTLPQASVLAGLVKNPNGYSPTAFPDAAIERRNVVLDRMAQLHVISQKRADQVEKQKLGLHVQQTSNGCVSSVAPFFCSYLISYLQQDPDLGKTPADRLTLLKSGGLTIHTTIDLADQRAADASVAKHVFPRDGAIGAMAMEQPGTGEVLALAQSRPIGTDTKAGQTFLNFTVPTKYGQSAGFQAGSTFKAFVLATAINKGIPLDTVIPSPTPMTFDLANFENCPGAGNFVGTQPISNSTGIGTPSFNLYTGTQMSINTFYMQLEEKTGVCKPYELAKAMGIELTDPALERVPEFTLGVDNVSPLEMAEAYATFGARGLHCDSRPVTSIDDSAGNVVKDYPATCTQVMPQSTADAVNSVLKGVQEPGGFGYDIGHTNLTKTAADGSATVIPSAGKTGTTQDGKSVWFMGYTPAIATAAMIAGANDLGAPDPLYGKSIGGNVTYEVSGSGFAGPMWADAMHAIENTLPVTPFVVPSGDDVKGVQITVPDTGGLSVEAATKLLQAKGFTTQDGGVRDTGYAAGEVAYTYPSAGSTASNSQPITIYTSSGHEPFSGGGGGRGGRGHRHR